LEPNAFELRRENSYCRIVVRPGIAAGSVLDFPLRRETLCIDTVFGFALARDYPALLDQFGEFLTSKEAAYFAELRFLRRRQSFLLGRYAAKLALLRLLKATNPKAIEIGRGVFEQPLISYLSARAPDVTISHCDEIAVALAFPSGHPMGVDIEQIDPDRLVTIQSQMSPVEREWARSAGADELAFSTLIWTAKEALSKALLCGLMSPMEIFNLAEFYPLGDRVWGGLFQNFGQYKFIGCISRRVAMSVVLPKKSEPAEGGMDFDAVLSNE
jgi:4'-phosphopantetheinyl transferase